MSRFGRRTFLASSTGIAAGAAVAGALPPGAAVADGEDAARSLRSAGRPGQRRVARCDRQRSR